MGTSPAPELANDFAFWDEFDFLSHMVQEHKQYCGPGRYPFEFITQYTLVVLRGILMTSSLCLLTIRLDLRYKIFFHKMVSSMVCTLLRCVSSMVM